MRRVVEHMRVGNISAVSVRHEPDADSAMALQMVIDVLQEGVDVAHEGVPHPGAFSADFIERHVLPYLRQLHRLGELY
jgi:hypothetical protein